MSVGKLVGEGCGGDAHVWIYALPHGLLRICLFCSTLEESDVGERGEEVWHFRGYREPGEPNPDGVTGWISPPGEEEEEADGWWMTAH